MMAKSPVDAPVSASLLASNLNSSYYRASSHGDAISSMGVGDMQHFLPR